MPGSLFWKNILRYEAQLARMAVGSIRDHQFGAFLRARFVGAWYITGILIDRHRIQKNRKVSVEYIDEILYHGRPPRPPVIGGVR